MDRDWRIPLLAAVAAAAVMATGPALARPFGAWGDPEFGDPFYRDRWHEPLRSDAKDSREGKVDADRFVAEGAKAQLGHGSIALVVDTQDKAVLGNELAPEPGDTLPYQGAIIDQLVKAGYDTQTPNPKDGQVVELRFHRETLVPEERKRKPVSGETSVMVSNRGTAYGMALNLDFTKPKKALVSTRIDAQIKDLATNKTLWEGHASIATREGDSHWGDQAIATRLATALFDGFPNKSTAVLAAR